MYPAITEPLAVIYPLMPNPIRHQAIVTFESLRVDEAPSLDLLYRGPQETLCAYLFDDLHPHLSLSLQYPKHRYLPLGSPSSLSFPFPPKRAFVCFDLSFHKMRIFGGAMEDGFAHQTIHFVHRVVGSAQFFVCPVDGNL